MPPLSAAARRSAAALGLVLWFAAPGAAAGGGPCDERLRPVSGASGYRFRGNRCEGQYVSPISAPTLELLGVVRGTLRYDLSPGARVSVRAPTLGPLGSAPVRVQAVSKPFRTYYRMDAVLPAGATLEWPVGDVLHPMGLGAQRVGLCGWVEADGGRVFVPLEASPVGQTSTSGPIRLTVRSAARIEKVVWRIYSAGQAPPPWSDAAGVLRAGDPLDLDLPNGPAGVVTVEFQAKVEGSDRWARLAVRVLRGAP